MAIVATELPHPGLLIAASPLFAYAETCPRKDGLRVNEPGIAI
jgi:hypothetical protein